MSNDSGYKILQGTPPPQAMIDAAKAEISADNLQKIQNSTSNLGFEALGWGADCDKLLHYGLDLDGDQYLNHLLSGPYKDARTQTNGVVVWMENPTQLQRLRAGRNCVFIYRTVEEELGPENGLFRIVEGSHRMSAEQVLKEKAKDISLLPGQAIIMDGELVIEYPKEGGRRLGLLKSMYKSVPKT